MPTMLGGRICKNISFEAGVELYGFARLVFFVRKIAMTDNSIGNLPLFFEH
jgi:hypothetical protein